VSVRWIPLVTAAYGTWVARLGENNKAPHWRRGLQLDSWVRRAHGDDCLVGKPLNSARLVGQLLPLSDHAAAVVTASW
jgi:hypothetical protein